MDQATQAIPDELFRLAFDSAASGMALLSLEGNVVYSNQTLQRMLCCSAEKLRGEALVSYFHPQDQLACTYALERALRARNDLPSGALRYRHDDEGYQWARYQLRMISDAQGAPLYYLARLESILERHEQAEQVHLLAFALDYALDGIVLLDDGLRVRYANDSARAMLSDDHGGLLGMPIGSLVPAWSRDSHTRLAARLRSGQDLYLELGEGIDGTRLPVSIHVDAFHYDQRGYSLMLMRDLSEQQRMERALLENERQFRALIENTPDAIGRLSPDFHLLYANPALERLCQLPLVEARGRPAQEAFGYSSQVEIMAELVRQVADTGKALEEELIYGVDQPPDQQSHHMVKLVPERDQLGRVRSVISVARDVTGLRAAERELETTNLQLRELASRRESAREEERKLIAQEIHDELGQHLTALRMGISLLRLQFGAENPGLAERVEHLMGLCDRTIGVVRSITTSLRPSALNMGLKAALEWLVAEFTRSSGIDCRLYSHLDDSGLDESATITLFRIVQEALTNVARHAGAERVVITLENEDEHCLVDISDNGRGFDPLQVKHSTLGLAGMRERGLSQGGRVVIFSHPGQGTTVQARFPMRHPQEKNP